MKFPLLTTTLLATSQFRATADQVKPDSQRLACLIASTREKGISPVMARLLTKQPSHVACTMLKSLASRPRTCATHTGQPTTAKVELPPTPASNTLAKFDYRKGDDASTVEEFAKALEGDFVVTSNKNAKNPDLFRKNPIMVYGENHIEPVVPSLRTPKGVLLLESENPDCFMPKHKMDSANRRILIDKDKETEIAIMRDLDANLERLLDLLDPNLMDTIIELGRAHGLNQPAMREIATRFISQNYHTILDDATPEKQEVLKSTYNKVDHLSRMQNERLLNLGGQRDQAMLKECEKAIANLPEDASATIVVGMLHGRYLATKLSEKFPDRAVVLAVVADQEAQELDAQIKQAMKK